MPAQSATLTPWARRGLAMLCLLLAASVLVRIQVYRGQPDGGSAAWEASGGPVDLGGGVALPRAAALPLAVRIAACPTPASVAFVRVNPYQSDPSLVGPVRPGDRVAYVYRGWNLGSRLITISLNAIYFARLAYARALLQPNPALDELALKIIVPAGCDAAPEAVLSVLRSSRLPRPGSAAHASDLERGAGGPGPAILR